LRVFDAIESEQQSACAWFVRFRISAVGLEEIFDGEELGGADEGDYAWWEGVWASWVSCSRASWRTRTPAWRQRRRAGRAGHPGARGDEDVIEAAAAGLDRFFDRMHAIKTS